MKHYDETRGYQKVTGEKSNNKAPYLSVLCNCNIEDICHKMEALYSMLPWRKSDAL